MYNKGNKLKKSMRLTPFFRRKAKLFTGFSKNKTNINVLLRNKTTEKKSRSYYISE